MLFCFIFDKINGKRYLNLLGMTTYSGLYRLHSLNKFIDWISEVGHNYGILSTKKMMNVPACSYYGVPWKKTNKKSQQQSIKNVG